MQILKHFKDGVSSALKNLRKKQLQIHKKGRLLLSLPFYYSILLSESEISIKFCQHFFNQESAGRISNGKLFQKKL